jgi:hypothetical protein
VSTWQEGGTLATATEQHQDTPRRKSQLWWVLTSIVALIAIASGMPIDRGICRQLKGHPRVAFC